MSTGNLPSLPGTHPGDDCVALARAGAEVFRGLPYSTRAPGLSQPSAACDVLASPSMAAARTGQVLAQIARYLDTADAAGHLGHDYGHNPSLAVDAAATFLADAQLSAAALAGDLDAACQQLALINGRGHRTPQDQP